MCQFSSAHPPHGTQVTLWRVRTLLVVIQYPRLMLPLSYVVYGLFGLKEMQGIVNKVGKMPRNLSAGKIISNSLYIKDLQKQVIARAERRFTKPTHFLLLQHLYN